MGSYEKKNALVLFSGGKDSFYATLLILEKGYNVKLLTYENGCGVKSENAIETAKRIQLKYGIDRVEILGVLRTAAIWREFTYLFYNKTISEILKKYGNTTISQLNCLSCRLAMYVMTIILCPQIDIQLVVDGARKSQFFAIEQDILLEKFQIFFNKYNLKIDFPLKDLQDDFELKNQLLIRNFVPKTLEPQCLLGMPLSSQEMTEEITGATTNVFEELLLPKAYELIDKYKNINILRENIYNG